MKEWYSIKELAGLPELPGTVQNINGKAKREAWKKRKRTARGGGYEYHINSLPQATQNHLSSLDTQRLMDDIVSEAERDSEALQRAQNELDAVDAAVARVNLSSTRARDSEIRARCAQRLSGLGSNHKLRLAANARRWLLSAWKQRAAEQSCTIRACVDRFCRDVIAGDLEIPAKLHPHAPRLHGQIHVTRSTLYRWRDDYARYGLGGLLPKPSGRLGKGIIDKSEALQRLIIGTMWHKPHASAAQMMDVLDATFDSEIPSKPTVARFMRRWKEQNAQLWAYVTNPDQWKNVHMASQGSHHESITALNQLWEADSTPADWMLKDGRHSVIGIIDMMSRRLKLRVSKTSKASAICLCVRDSIMAWGLPDKLRTDNGKDYTSLELVESLQFLEIRHELCMPFASEQKGTIERAFKTMSHGVLELLPGFIGHNVAERKVIEARKSFAKRVMTPGEVIEAEITGDELQQILDDWCDHIYGRNAHSGLSGRSPLEAAAAWRQPIKTCDERVLDFLLQEVSKECTVTKKGITYQHHKYICPEITEHTGERVRMRVDSDRLDRIYVYSLLGDFIGIAHCPELSGIDRQEAAVAAKVHQRKFLAAQKAEYSEHKKSIGKDIARFVLDHRIEQAGNVSVIKPPSVELDNHAVRQAKRAIAAADAMDADLQQLAQDILNPTVEAHAAAQGLQDDPIERHRRFMRIAQRVDDGDAVSDEETRRFERYRESPDYQSMAEFFEDFGLDQHTGEPS